LNLNQSNPMKYKLILFFLLAFLIPSIGQKKNNQKPATPPPAQAAPAPKAETPAEKPAEPAPAEQTGNTFLNHFFLKYQVASRFGDSDVARDALYDLIIEYPGNDSLFMELGVMYFEAQKFTSAVLVGQELLARNPKNPTALELTGSAFEALNLKDKALQNFETLYLTTNSFPALYKMAFLQYDVKRFTEAQATTDILLSRKEADEIKVTFNTAEKKSKDYPIRLSVLNLKGMIARDSGDKAGAKKYFEQVLAIAPDFLQAKEGLTSLK